MLTPNPRRQILGALLALPAAAFALSGAGAASDTTAPGPVKEFTMTAKRFAFEPAQVEVSEGDTVRIVVRSADGKHGIEIKEFKVKQLVPKGGEAVTVEFVAGKSGTFPIKCSEWCGNGHRSMTATLVVKPAGS